MTANQKYAQNKPKFENFKLNFMIVKINVYAKQSAVDNDYVDFALEVAKKVIDYFETYYFKISDAVPPKVDLIALPEYSRIAAEHWGMISFRESDLLFLNSLNSVTNKQRVALAIAHELSHFVILFLLLFFLYFFI